MEYYEAREEGLAQLAAGEIRILIEHQPRESGGVLRVCVDDTGPGFDFDKKRAPLEAVQGNAGRGLPLVDSLSETIRFAGDGNQVEVSFSWKEAGVVTA